jgi:NAD(P)-dependent dehydrogenase (short-subunit alcohol dehydrogenase family)
MDKTLTGQVAIVTGAASGIGNAIAHRLASLGATVVGVDLSDAVADSMAQLEGAGHHGITSDLTVEGAAATIVDEAVRIAGGVSILINSAGIAVLDDALTLSARGWNATIDVNLSASFFMAQAAGRVMVKAGYGRIVNLASQASVIGLDQHVAYCASKAGLLGMTRVMSMEWAGAGVTVNCISPTIVDTPLAKLAWDGEKGDDMKRRIPVGRFAQPEEIAGLAAYLVSAEAAMITGENILIDGGFSSI